ncbi:MAG: chemotaxis protein CheW [Candidatus Electrothrix sp. YB6]
MKKVCLVQGGDFVLGIDSRSILSRQNGTVAVQSAAERNREIIHLGALLSQQPFETEIPSPDCVILELRTGKTSFFLLVDQVVDELEVTRQPTALPPSSSARTGKLCPAAVVIGNNVVLLLNPARVLPVADQLGSRAGRAAKPLSSDAAGARKKKVLKKAPEKTAAPAAPVAEQSSSVPKTKLHKAEPEQAKKRAAPSGTGTAPAPAERRQKRKQQKNHPAVVDEETFHKVMTWTIAQFSQGRVEHEQITADQLPPELLPKNGVNRKVIQYLIDQIALRCQGNKETMNRNRPGEQHGG